MLSTKRSRWLSISTFAFLLVEHISVRAMFSVPRKHSSCSVCCWLWKSMAFYWYDWKNDSFFCFPCRRFERFHFSRVVNELENGNDKSWNHYRDEYPYFLGTMFLIMIRHCWWRCHRMRYWRSIEKNILINLTHLQMSLNKWLYVTNLIDMVLNTMIFKMIWMKAIIVIIAKGCSNQSSFHTPSQSIQ